MAKPKSAPAAPARPANLFVKLAKRRRRALVLQKYLVDEADKPVHRGPRQDRAFEILGRWAELESKGHLGKKETSLDASFLHEVFGEGLGYRTATENPEKYELERNFTVEGTGTADGALGLFATGAQPRPLAVIELKAAGTDLDRDKFNGRTAVQQCWDRHIRLSAADIALFNPNTRTCPVFRTRRDAQLTKAIYRRVPILVDESRRDGGNPWGIRFLTMFHQTNDAELFQSAEQLKELGCRLDGNRWTKRKQTFVPLYEAKMVQAFDHRAASVEVVDANWVRQGQTIATSQVSHQNPEFVVQPRWWVDEAEVDCVLAGARRPAYLCYKDVTSATNQRTMIAAMVPHVGLVNSAPLVLTGDAIGPRLACCLLANLNSLALDFVARQKVNSLHLNFFIVNQLAILPPDRYADRTHWTKRQTLEKWISDRVLKLTCTADDMRPLAEAAGLDPPIHKWKPDELVSATSNPTLLSC